VSNLNLQVGIHWAERSDEYGMTEVMVSKVHLDGPADRSGNIQEGDILVAVEGETFTGKGHSNLANRIPGPLNSFVNLTFNRGKRESFQLYYLFNAVELSIRSAE
jgi:C-terminal processing protease CtpA/Prc